MTVQANDGFLATTDPLTVAISQATTDVPISFTLNPTSSVLNGAGTVTVSDDGLGGSGNLEQEGPGSLSTTYSGILAAVYNSQGETLQFGNNSLGQVSQAVAANSGTWLPGLGGVTASGAEAPAAPANYAGTVDISVVIESEDVTLAVRNLAIDVASNPLTLSNSSGTATLQTGEQMTVDNAPEPPTPRMEGLV